jgi:hypothetical protein
MPCSLLARRDRTLHTEWSKRPLTLGAHKSRGPGRPGDKLLYGSASYLWALSMKLVSCHHIGALNFEVAPIFLELCTPALEAKC